MGVDYCVNISNDRKPSKLDFEAGDLLNHKAKSEIEENGRAILKGEEYDAVGYDWAFNVFKGGYQAPVGSPVVRIAKQLRVGKSNTSRIRITGAKSGGRTWSVR